MDYTLILQTYTLEEILEWNDVTPDEALAFMVGRGFILLPDPRPLGT